MIVGITGAERKLGAAISSMFNKTVNISNIEEIGCCDVFINNYAFSNLQEEYFKYVFNLWVNESKTIVNIVSSVVFDEFNTLGSYGEVKKTFHQSIVNTIKINPNKKVRVINIFPSTLSSNKSFDNLNKVDILKIAELVKYVIDLPQEIEVRDITIYPVTLEKNFNVESLL